MLSWALVSCFGSIVGTSPWGTLPDHRKLGYSLCCLQQKGYSSASLFPSGLHSKHSTSWRAEVGRSNKVLDRSFLNIDGSAVAVPFSKPPFFGCGVTKQSRKRRQVPATPSVPSSTHPNLRKLQSGSSRSRCAFFICKIHSLAPSLKCFCHYYKENSTRAPVRFQSHFITTPSFDINLFSPHTIPHFALHSLSSPFGSLEQYTHSLQPVRKSNQHKVNSPTFHHDEVLCCNPRASSCSCQCSRSRIVSYPHTPGNATC